MKNIWYRLKTRLRNRLMKFLYIDKIENKLSTVNNATGKLRELTHNLTHIGVDVHFKEPHMILIYSRLNGGQIREIPARFGSIKELDEFVRQLKQRYNTNIETWDYPRPTRNRL